jgi:RNA polymerase sigma-70 factor (ECF subfamily)
LRALRTSDAVSRGAEAAGRRDERWERRRELPKDVTLKDSAPPTLDEWLVRAAAGDRAGLAALVHAHQRAVYSLALRMLGTREAAEDLAQEVFMELGGKLRSLESNAHVSFWLRRVTTHRAIDQLRRRARVEMTSLEAEEPVLFSPEDSHDPVLERSLRTLLEDLTPPARAVLLLRYQEDLDPVDIAKTLDMPVNTVKSHLKRSLDTLRQGMPAETLDAHEKRRDE